MKIYEEIIKNIKSSLNYFNIYTKQNLLPLPQKPVMIKTNNVYKLKLISFIDFSKENEENLNWKREIVNYNQDKSFFSQNFNTFSYEKEVVPLVFSDKLAKALGMKSIYSPPPYFNKLNELGVPYYFKSI